MENPFTSSGKIRRKNVCARLNADARVALPSLRKDLWRVTGALGWSPSGKLLKMLILYG